MLKRHFRTASYFPNNVTMAFIDDSADNYDQLVSPPSDTSSSNRSDSPLPPPPDMLSPGKLVTDEIKNGSGHATKKISKTETSDISEIIIHVKEIDQPHRRRSKCTCRTCSFICVLCSTLVIAAFVFAIVFGLHHAWLPEGWATAATSNETYTGGDFIDSENVNRTSPGALLLTTTAIIGAPETTTLTTTTEATITTESDVGWKRMPPFKNVPTHSRVFSVSSSTTSTTSSTTTTTPKPTTTTTTTSMAQKIEFAPTTKSTTTTPTTTSTTPSTTMTTTHIPAATTQFYQNPNKVYGDLNYFMNKNESIIISPFGIDYILSFIGNLGNETEKNAVQSYFRAPLVADVYVYYKALQKALFKKNDGFMLSDFVTGNEVEGNFMIEQTSFDNVSLYHASDRSYAHYFNEMFKKRSYDQENNSPFFEDDHFSTPEKNAIGFSHIQKSLHFIRVKTGFIENRRFLGVDNKQRFVNQFVTSSFNAEFGDYRLHAIPFQNKQIHMFIVENLKDDNLIPTVDPNEILNNLKVVLDPENSKPFTPICVPEIKQQNTVEISEYLNQTLKDSHLSIYTPFNDAKNGEVKYEINKFYQALRFDVSFEGVNIHRTHSAEAITFKACTVITNPFVYGLVFRNQVFIYYGAFA